MQAEDDPGTGPQVGPDREGGEASDPALSPEAKAREAADFLAAQAEVRLEALADEIAEVIDDADPADQVALHDYAVSLVRERLPLAEADERFARPGYGQVESGAGGTRVAAGYGVLLLMVAPLMLFVFPTVGFMLGVVGGGLLLAGLSASMLARFRGK